MTSLLKSLRNAFISGLLLLAPVGITIYVMIFLVEKIGGPTSELFFFWVPNEWGEIYIFDILATALVVVLITILGWVSKFLIGRILLQTIERILDNLPFVNNVYKTVKQIFDTFSQQKRNVFQKVVLIQFPRKGMYAIGFLTGTGKGEIQHRTEHELINIFLPTTPNPTSGYLIMVPIEDVTILEMTIAEGMKLIISGGAVVPPYDPEKGASPVQIQNPKEVTMGN